MKCQPLPLVSSSPDNDDENGYCPDKNCRVVDARVALTEDELGRTRREIERNERDSRKKREKNAKVKLAFAAGEGEKRTRLEK